MKQATRQIYQRILPTNEDFQYLYELSADDTNLYDERCQPLAALDHPWNEHCYVERRSTDGQSGCVPYSYENFETGVNLTDIDSNCLVRWED